VIRVLFVCLGNICRSPMAEAVFRHKVKEAGLAGVIEADSAGTSGWHEGEPPHHGTRRVLDRHGIDYSGIFARPVVREDFHKFDYIVAMDDRHVQDLEHIFGGKKHPRLFRLLDLQPDCENKNVPDPYYHGNFDEVHEMIDRGCDLLLAHIRENDGL